MTSFTQLSDNDIQVAKSVLDQQSWASMSASSNLIDPSLPPSMPFFDPELLPTVQAAEKAALLPLNVPFPPPPLLHLAIAQLTDLINLHPTYASAYNNRAQARRLLGDDNIHPEPEQWSLIWDDLCEAIRLATPTMAGARVSVRHGDLLAAAHMQRGLLIFSLVRRTNGSVSRTGGGLGNEAGCVDHKGLLPKQFWGLDTTDLEAMASRDFENAGRYGDKAAWEMSAATNPYARLCGEIVKEAIRAEIEGAKFQDTSSVASDQISLKK